MNLLDWAKTMFGYVVKLIPIDWVATFVLGLIKNVVKATPTKLDDDGLMALEAILVKLKVISSAVDPSLNDTSVVLYAVNILDDLAALTSTKIDDNVMYTIKTLLMQVGVIPLQNLPLPSGMGMFANPISPATMAASVPSQLMGTETA